MSEENKTPPSAQPNSKPAGAPAPKPALKKPALKKPAAAGSSPAGPTIKIGARPVAKTPRIDLADKTADEAAQPAPAKPAGEADLGTLKQAIQKTSAQIESARKDLQKPPAPVSDIREKEVPPAPGKKATMFMDVDAIASAEPAAKKATMFMDVDSAEAEKPQPPPPVDAKKKTSRISTASAVPPAPQETLDEFTPAPSASLAKNATMFMNIEDDLGEAPQTQPKKQTARIDISSAIPSPRDTTKISAGAPATIRIKRPVTTSTARKPPARPPEPMVPHSVLGQQPGSAMMAEGKKSETSRIELPPDAVRPPTRKKTVKIKRPDGSDAGVPKLSLQRPVTSSFQAAQVEIPAKPEKEEAGIAFSIVSIAATIVLCVLVYVFLAQVLANGLPFPSPIN